MRYALLAHYAARESSGNGDCPIHLESAIEMAPNGSLYHSLVITNPLPVSVWAIITAKLIRSTYGFVRGSGRNRCVWEVGPMRLEGTNPLAPETRVEFRRGLTRNVLHPAPGLLKLSVIAHIHYQALRPLSEPGSVDGRLSKLQLDVEVVPLSKFKP